MIGDTSPQVEAFLVQGFRRMTAADKLKRVAELSQAVQELALADIRARHPNASERECLLRLASRRLPAEMMRTVFGWDPDTAGY